MENSLWLELVFPVAMLALQVVLAIVVGSLAFFMKRYFSEQDQRAKEQDRKIEKNADDLSDFRAAAPETFVLRDDYILKMSGVDNKLGSMGEKVGELQGFIRKGER